MTDKKQIQLPPGLKTRQGVLLGKHQRLPSMNSLISQIQGKNSVGSSSGCSASTIKTTAASFTRGGAAKRVFKPKIPAERVKQEPIDSSNNGASTSSLATTTNGPKNDANNKSGRPDRKSVKGKDKEVIQIKGTFENFKVEPKSRDTGSGGGGGGGGYSRSSGKSSGKIKKESNKSNGISDVDFPHGNNNNDDLRQYESDEEMEMDDEFFDSSWDSEEERAEKPICWEERIGSKTESVKKEQGEGQATKESTMAELEQGKLILLPMIFGTAAGDTGYKLQVMSSGRMRLVNKKTGFCIDLVNASSDKQGGIKEVVEVEGENLIRYGTLNDKDIYSPIRARESL